MCSSRKVLAAEVQIDVELIARELPPVTRLGQERDHPGVHHGDLPRRITVVAQPYVANQADSGIKVCFHESLALVLPRTPNDEFDLAVVRR